MSDRFSYQRVAGGNANTNVEPTNDVFAVGNAQAMFLVIIQGGRLTAFRRKVEQIVVGKSGFLGKVIITCKLVSPFTCINLVFYDDGMFLIIPQ